MADTTRAKKKILELKKAGYKINMQRQSYFTLQANLRLGDRAGQAELLRRAEQGGFANAPYDSIEAAKAARKGPIKKR